MRCCSKETHRWIIFVMLCISWFLTVMSLRHCSFFKVGNGTTPYNDLYAYGIYSTPVYDRREPSETNLLGCIAYPKAVTIDPALKAARAMGVFLGIFVSLALLGFTLIHFFVMKNRNIIYTSLKILLPLCLICQASVFACLVSFHCTREEKCTQGPAGILADINLCFLFMLSVLVCVVPQPEHPIFRLWDDNYYYRSASEDSDLVLNKIQSFDRKQDCDEERGVHTGKANGRVHARDYANKVIGSGIKNNSDNPYSDLAILESIDLDDSSDQHSYHTTTMGPIAIRTVRQYQYPNGTTVTSTTAEVPNPDGTLTITEQIEDYANDDNAPQNGLTIDVRGSI